LSLGLACSLASAPTAWAASAGYQGLASYEVVVGASKSQVVELPGSYSDVMVADPKVADVLPLNSHSVYIVGKTMGSTAVTIFGPGKRLLAAVSVVVSPDIETFKARLHEVLPGERDVAARAANDSIVVSGTVTSPAVLEQVVKLAETYAPGKVVNMLSVEGTQEVMLSVRFVEMERNTAKDLRINVQTPMGLDGKFPFQIHTVGTNFNPSGSSTLQTIGTIATFMKTGAGDMSIVFDALETRGLIKTLAEPNLVAQSGDTANFLAGGEFPVPVAQSSGVAGGAPVITVDFKQFGIGLGFTPTILRDGLINLIVSPEVSSIDTTQSVTSNGIQIPGLKVRRAHTTIELHDGESFTIAGLLADSYQNGVNQFPFIGDIPVLGALFRSSGFQRDETELVIVVTPHLVTPRHGEVATPADRFVPPSDFELFVLGAARGTGEGLAPEDRALMSADPTKGGLDGPHGHVLY
jgi:pilus assembly protein CpaC